MLFKTMSRSVVVTEHLIFRGTSFTVWHTDRRLALDHSSWRQVFYHSITANGMQSYNAYRNIF